MAGTCIVSPFGEILSKTESCKPTLITADIDLANCEAVNAQKYWGTRSMPEVLMTTLIDEGIGIHETISHISKRISLENTIDLVKEIHKENLDYKYRWKEESKKDYSLFSKILL